MSLDLSVEGGLVELAPLIATVIAQRWAGGTKAKGAAQGGSSVSKSEEVAATESGFDLAYHTSRVMQR